MPGRRAPQRSRAHGTLAAARFMAPSRPFHGAETPPRHTRGGDRSPAARSGLAQGHIVAGTMCHVRPEPFHMPLQTIPRSVVSPQSPRSGAPRPCDAGADGVGEPRVAPSFALLTPRLPAFRVAECPESSMGALPPIPRLRSRRRPGGRGQLPARSSHRSGHARLGHPAPRTMVLLLNATHRAPRAPAESLSTAGAVASGQRAPARVAPPETSGPFHAG